MKSMGLLLILTALLGTSLGRLHGQYMEARDPRKSVFSVNESTFVNHVDHFDHSNRNTFEQRYWYTLDLWEKGTGPIYLVLCGESMGHFPRDDTFVMKLANSTKGAVVALEHRYYGHSMPVPDLSLENLKYLTHDQALADTANFIKFFKRSIRAGTTKVIVVGGSYAGALSAWMRYKYPHLITGAISSSGVVNAVLDFYQFDDQVKRSVLKSGEECENIVHKFFDEAKALWEKDPWILKEIHKAPYFEWDDFMFYYADIFVETVQYGRRTYLCKFLKEIENAPDRQLKLARLAIENRAAPHTYSFEYIRTIQIDPYNEFRQWTYQFCSALGDLNTVGTGDKPMRFKDMNLDYWRRYCTKCFDASIFPNTFNTNSVYGDVRMANVVSNVAFTNGGEDPWQWSTVRRYKTNKLIL